MSTVVVHMEVADYLSLPLGRFGRVTLNLTKVVGFPRHGLIYMLLCALV